MIGKRRAGSKIRSILADERGMAFILVAISMVAVVSAAALAIDIGSLVTARTESQRVADASALAGASALLVDPGDAAGAVARAKDYAARNTIRGQAALVLDEDVFVDLNASTVRVFVQNIGSRNNAIGTFFARVFGVRSVDVRTVATAWAAPATGVEEGGSINDCLLPIGFLDFQDTNGDGYYTDGEPPLGFNQAESHGMLLKLSFSGSTGQGPPYCRDEPAEVFNANPDVDYCNGFEDSWSCWWRDSQPSQGGGGGTGPLADAIMGRTCPGVEIPQEVWQASAGGEKQSLIQSDDLDGGTGSFRDLIEMDDGVQWCSALDSGTQYGCVQRGGCSTTSACETESPRIRNAPIIDTANISGSGANNTFTIDGLTGVFIERVSCNYSAGDFGGPAGNWNVYVRIMSAGVTGSGSSGETPPDVGQLLRRLKLIE